MNQVKAQILRLIAIVSDTQFQKDVWRDGKYLDNVFSFGETVNLLGDYLFYDYLETNEFRINAQEDLNTVRAFTNYLLEYDEYRYGSHGMLTDPNWILITNEAKKSLGILSSTPFFVEIDFSTNL